MATYKERVEALLADDEPGPGRVIEISASELASRMRARAEAVARYAGGDAVELRKAAELLDGGGQVRLHVAAIDLAALVGTGVAATFGR